MKRHSVITLALFLLLLSGCNLPIESGPILTFIPTITTENTLTDTVPVLAPGTVTLTPFMPVENTATFTQSSTVSPTASETSTLTITITGTLTRTTSATPSKTPTTTSTPSLSRTPTKTLSATISRTPSNTYTPSKTGTATNTYSPSLTGIPTSTRTFTPTRTASVSHTPSLSPTITDTPTTSQTPIDTLIPSLTATPTPTSAISATPTRTATRTATRTSTWTPIAGCSPIYDASLESQVVTLLNQERQNNGLPPLAVQSALTAAARAHSMDMACNAFFSHIGSDGSTSRDRVARQGYSAIWVGENIYGGMSSSPTVVVTWWMNSAPHRANILHNVYTSIGIGYVYVPSAPYQKYWTAVFAQP